MILELKAEGAAMVGSSTMRSPSRPLADWRYEMREHQDGAHRLQRWNTPPRAGGLCLRGAAMLDMHVHSTSPTASCPPRALVRAAKGTGRRGLALTDYEHPRGPGRAGGGGPGVWADRSRGRGDQLRPGRRPAAAPYWPTTSQRPAGRRREALCRPIRQGSATGR